ncbi:hypothetical protein SVA_3703 [Sulfurifustis variabilis]|uniref:Uncharacterized protein n=1 Tax=Sulfurifustis variabilis TaxID=1675686 RepID=A0A1B4VGZ7_9GAMM|nr:hypothetical protein [Sulfurifustis variabilis]BAU50237.1 hypothetical protein SVA_3703 [Sulfurifustis variabilis]
MQDAVCSQDQRLQAAVFWQGLAGRGLLHPLSCRVSTSHAPLEPQESDKGEAILVCVDCGYATLVPDPILRIWQAMRRFE